MLKSVWDFILSWEIILVGISGGITGYVTNSFAIKRIFRKLEIPGRKMHVGGYIVKKRENFSERIGETVEDEIINPGNIKRKIETERFKEVARKVVSSVIDDMQSQTGCSKIREISGYEETKRKMLDIFRVHLEKSSPDLLDIVLKEVSMDKIIDKKQIEYFSANLSKQLLNYILEEERFKHLAQDLLKNERFVNLKFKDFFSQRQYNTFKENIRNETGKFPELLKKRSSEIDEFIEGLYRDLKISDVINELSESIGERKLSSFIGESHNDSVANTLRKNIEKFIDSENGKTLLEKIVAVAIDELSDVNRPITYFLSDDLQSRLEDFFKSGVLHDVVASVLKFLKNKNDNLTELLVDHFEKNIDKKQKGWLEWLSDLFSGKLIIVYFFKKGFKGSKEKIGSKILKYFEDNMSEEEFSKLVSEMMEKLLFYLKKVKVSDFINKLRNGSIINESDLVEILSKNIYRYQNKISDDILEKVLDVKIKTFFPKLNNFIEEMFKEIIIKEFKEKYLFNEWSGEKLFEGVCAKIETLYDSTFKDFLNSGDLMKLHRLIKSKELYLIEELKKEMAKKIGEHIKDKKAVELIGKDARTGLSKEVSAYIYSSVDKKASELEDKSCNVFLGKIKNNNSAMLTDLAFNQINDNVGNLIKNNVKEIVKDNLSEKNMPDSELQEMVEEFMGKELKPINFFGAFLGFVAAVGSFLLINQFWPWKTQISLNIFSHSLSLPYLYLVYAVVFAVVGWGTNVLALNMLFQSRFLIKGKVRVWKSVVESRKESFAVKMAELVSTKLVSKESVKKVFDKKEKNLLDFLGEKLSEKDFKMLSDFYKEHSGLVKNKILEMIIKWTEDNRNNLAQFIGDKNLGDIAVLSEDEISEKVSEYILEEIKPLYLGSSGEKIKEFMEEERTAEDFLCQFDLDLCETRKRLNTMFISEIEGILKRNKDAKEGLAFLNIDDKVLEKSLDEILVKDSSREFIINEISGKVADIISGNKDPIVKKIAEFLSSYLKSNEKVLHSGFVRDLIHNNINDIYNILKNKIFNLLEVNKSSVANEFYENIYEVAKENNNHKKVERIRNDIVETFKSFLSDKLKGFINDNSEELKGLAEDSIRRVLDNKSFSDFSFVFHDRNIEETVSGVFDSSKFRKILEKFGVTLVESFMQMPVGELLKVSSLNNIDQLMAIFNKEISEGSYRIEKNLKSNKESVENRMRKVIELLFDDTLKNTYTNQIFRNISKKDIEAVISKVDSNILSLPEIKGYLHNLILEIVNTYIVKSINNILDKNEFEQTIPVVVDDVLESEDVQKMLQKFISDIFDEFGVDFRLVVDRSLLEYISNVISEAVINSVGIHIYDILNSLEINDLTKEEVKKFSEDKIKEIFYNSFGEDTFKKIEHYGFWGGVFGIHPYCVPIFLALEKACEVVSYKNENNSQKRELEKFYPSALFSMIDGEIVKLEDIINSASNNENEWLEFKSGVNGVEKPGEDKFDTYWRIAKAVISLANSSGGAVIIGVDEDCLESDKMPIGWKASDPDNKCKGKFDIFYRDILYHVVLPKNNTWNCKKAGIYQLKEKKYLGTLITPKKFNFRGEEVAAIIVDYASPGKEISVVENPNGKKRTLYYDRTRGDVGECELSEGEDVEKFKADRKKRIDSTTAWIKTIIHKIEKERGEQKKF